MPVSIITPTMVVAVGGRLLGRHRNTGYLLSFLLVSKLKV